jgi:hypothetical protein
MVVPRLSSFFNFLFKPPAMADTGTAGGRKSRSATAKRQLPVFPLLQAGRINVVAVQGVEPRTLRI